MYVLVKTDDHYLPPMSENAKKLYNELVEYAPMSAEQIKQIAASDWKDNDDFVDAIKELKHWHLIKEENQ